MVYNFYPLVTKNLRHKISNVIGNLIRDMYKAKMINVGYAGIECEKIKFTRFSN